MITDCYDIQSEPLLSLRDFYGEPGHKVEKCLILFSKHIHQHLLVNFDCEPIGTLNSCNGSKTIYQFCHEGENIGFYLTDLGSAVFLPVGKRKRKIQPAVKFISTARPMPWSRFWKKNSGFGRSIMQTGCGICLWNCLTIRRNI